MDCFLLFLKFFCRISCLYFKLNFYLHIHFELQFKNAVMPMKIRCKFFAVYRTLITGAVMQTWALIFAICVALHRINLGSNFIT